MTFFKRLYSQWRELLAQRSYAISLLGGFSLLVLAYFINYRATIYTSEIPVLSVGDLILERLPTVNLSFLYTFGIYFVALVYYLYPILFKPELVPFTLKTVAAFVIIRAVFISLTHLGAPADFFNLPQYTEQPSFFKLWYMNDLFFSGHTGFPFLGALIFWENKIVRYFLLSMSFVQAATVLLMHVHYSIDVFSAYFITYSIYVVSDKIFNNLNLKFRRVVQKLEHRFWMRLRR